MATKRKTKAPGTSRRSWLIGAAAGVTLAILGGVAWQLRRVRVRALPVTDHERAMISRIVDLLVPRDETPGAVDLGIHKRLLAGLEDNAARAKFYAEALLSLDRDALAKHGAEFLALDTAWQESLLRSIYDDPRPTPGWRTLHQLRSDTMRLYYAQPAVWPSLGFDGPPQPGGFLDYGIPPRSRA